MSFQRKSAEPTVSCLFSAGDQEQEGGADHLAGRCQGLQWGQPGNGGSFVFMFDIVLYVVGMELSVLIVPVPVDQTQDSSQRSENYKIINCVCF